MTNQTFQSLGLKPEILDIVEKLNFYQPTEIQQKVIPAALKGQSVIGQSHTGSGKSHAFILPLMNQMDPTKDEVQFVITAPTRELATQIYNEVHKMIQFAEKEQVWRAKLLIGGTDKEKAKDKLKTAPHIIVGTPGRILDMVTSGALSIYSAQSFVVDEADLMLDLGFIDDIDKLLVRCKQDIQLLVFSATIPERLQHFFKKYLENPLFIKIESQYAPEKMEHQFIDLKHRSRAKTIQNISTAIQPYLALIFTNGKQEADELHVELLELGLNAGIIHGGLNPRERKRALKDIQDLKYEYVVATDLASRGIDIPGVSHVINASLPKEEEFYIHRVGRTARAGLEGTAISLYTEADLPLVKKLEAKGLTLKFVEVKNSEFIEAKAWNKRATRKKTDTNLDAEAWKRVRKTTKVKPGYKKKMKVEQEKIKKQLGRQNRRRTGR